MDDAIKWIEAHPYLSGGTAIGGAILVYLLWPSTPSGPPMTPAQALAMQRLVGNQQLSALRIQTQPALAQQGTERLGITSQAGSTNLAARLGASLSRFGIATSAASTDLQARLGSQLGLANLGEQTTLAGIQQSEHALDLSTSQAMQGAALGQQVTLADIAAAVTGRSEQYTFQQAVLQYLVQMMQVGGTTGPNLPTIFPYAYNLDPSASVLGTYPGFVPASGGGYGLPLNVPTIH